MNNWHRSAPNIFECGDFRAKLINHSGVLTRWHLEQLIDKEWKKLGSYAVLKDAQKASEDYCND